MALEEFTLKTNGIRSTLEVYNRCIKYEIKYRVSCDVIQQTERVRFAAVSEVTGVRFLSPGDMRSEISTSIEKRGREKLDSNFAGKRKIFRYGESKMNLVII